MKRVVITGAGIISPVGNTTAEFWDNIHNGRCGISEITRFDTSQLKVKIAAEVKNFDPCNYMDAKEARRMDLFCQYALASAQQAITDSGIDGKILPERFGVYMGSGIGGISTLLEECEKTLEKGVSRISPLFIPKMISNMASGHISIRFNARGVCLPVVTACATSTNAIGEAYRAIKHGYADAVIAGGAEAAIVPVAIAGFTNCMALSLKNDPLRSSTPFDKERDGFVMAEGACSLILEEYEHAVKRNAKIYAEIAGYGNTSDAYHVTAPNPSAEASSLAIKMALDEAGLIGSEPIYYNAHGTGTPLNDKTETLAVKKAFGQYAQQIKISSSKSITGHMLGAAGAAEALVSILALTQGIIPPTIGYRNFDPECDLFYTPNTAVKFDATAALSASFGFGGHNACIAMKKI
jgi:3-oxoacyl-[acyl-carrier-protein] synthase II